MPIHTMLLFRVSEHDASTHQEVQLWIHTMLHKQFTPSMHTLYHRATRWQISKLATVWNCMHPFRDAAFKTVSSEAEDSVLLVLATGAEPLATRLLVVGAELSIKLLPGWTIHGNHTPCMNVSISDDGTSEKPTHDVCLHHAYGRDVDMDSKPETLVWHGYWHDGSTLPNNVQLR